MRPSKVVLALIVFAALVAVFAACFQAPPAPVPPGDEEPAGGPGIVRDLTVPGHLNAARATVRDSLTVNGAASVGSLAVRGRLQVPSGSLTTDALSGFYFPLSFHGNVTASKSITNVIAAALLPAGVMVNSVDYFAQSVTGDVLCNIRFTIPGDSPAQNVISTNWITLTEGIVVSAPVDNGVLGAGYLLEFGCDTGVGEFADGILVTVWMK